MQATDIGELLKKRAYYVFQDDDDTEAQQLMEIDIDHILEQSSRTFTYGSSRKSTMSSGMVIFST